MTRYVRKPTTVDAERFTDALFPPPGVMSRVGRYGREFFVVTAQDRHVEVDVGEWIVREPRAVGCFYPVSEDDFAQLYEPAP